MKHQRILGGQGVPVVTLVCLLAGAVSSAGTLEEIPADRQEQIRRAAPAGLAWYSSPTGRSSKKGALICFPGIRFPRA